MSKTEYINLTTADVTNLISQIENSNLLSSVKQILITIIKNYTWLQLKLEQGKVTFKILREILLGFKSEKKKNLNAIADKLLSDNRQPLSENQQSLPEKQLMNNTETNTIERLPTAPIEKPKKPGHGRNSASSYKGADKVIIPNELSAGQECPEEGCDGKLYAVTPTNVVRILSKGLFNAVVYSLITLRCSLCGIVFRAKLPEDAGQKKYSAEVIAWLAFYKYYASLPFKRIETIQNLAEIPLPDSTQWPLVYSSYKAAVPVLELMTELAGESKLIHGDDTRGNILFPTKPEELINTDRKAIYTTGILAEYEGNIIHLYITGHFYAGENIGKILRNRKNEEKIIYMADALSMNTPKNISEQLLAKVITVFCLVHDRRQFLRLIESFPIEVKYVLELISKIYENEKHCKDSKLNALQRLLYHQKYSIPILNEWYKWLKKQFDEKLVEPNSSLGAAIKYTLKHWDKLTQFTRVEGAPIDNNILEMSLRIPIRLRKSAYFYKTNVGAAVGDCMMSLIYTCIAAKQQPIEYLTQLQINAASVAKNPSLWLPWNFKAQLVSSSVA